MFPKISALLIFLFVVKVCVAQNTYTISGFIRDNSTGETLIGAIVQGEDPKFIARTNNYGYYALSLPAGQHKLTFRYVGYAITEEVITINDNMKKNVELIPNQNELEEVVVSARKKNSNVESPQMGSFKFNTSEIRNIPVVFGEKDILKTFQLLPGVASGGEGSANFYVRGGGGDQNLILLDEATVYNSSHLLGFFSTFNSDAIKDVELYKGGIPSQYGGRISSVMDITMLDGNSKEFSMEGGIGLIASRLKVEAPIVKDKSSFMISGRRTYADMFLKLSNDEDAKKSKLYFYDLNAKANYKLNDKNTIYVSGYFGKDELGYSDKFSFDWGNATATLRWNNVINDKLFSNTSLIYSNFNYNVNVNSDNNEFKIASKINNWNFKEDFQYFTNPKNTFKFGVHLLYQKISPASLNATGGSEVNSIFIEPRKGLDASAYFSHEWKPTDRLSMIYGIRLSDFFVLGPGTFYNYDEEGEPIGSNTYGDNKVIKQYLNLEPRLSMSYKLNEKQSLKLSFNRITQNLHQLTNTTSSLPTDQYVLSSANIKPQYANQGAFGYFRNFKDNTYEFSVEAYYKQMGNQIDFRNGADLQANKYLEGELLYGDGRAYGLEWYLRKREGRFNGWISYTLSKSERQFDEINNGSWFNARQDRTHDVSVVGIYQLSKKWTLGATFVYNTGNAITFPSGKYEVDGRTMFYYTERNGYRMPAYHRLDLSATYSRKRPSKKYNSSWSFGVYNAYNRKNAYIIDFRENEDNSNITEAYRIALFGAIPSITWDFKF